MIFEVSPEQIAALSDSDLRILVGKLAEQEARKAKLSPSGVTYGGHQNASDGGIDVRVTFFDGKLAGFIPRLNTGYQVKAEDFPPSSIKQEMRPQGTLRPCITNLAQANGAYIIVSSKGTVSDQGLANRKRAMADALECKSLAANLHVDFYDRQRLATWVNQHPGLIAWVRNNIANPLVGWKPYDDWSSSPGGLDELFILDETIRVVQVGNINTEPSNLAARVNVLRAHLKEAGMSVRIVGLSGVGKTRLVQALFDERIGDNSLHKSDAIYTDLSDSPSPIPQELLSHLISLDHESVVIVDNCGVDLHKKLVKEIKKKNARIRLITVGYDIRDDQPEHTETFKLEPASQDTIQKILNRRYPELNDPDARTISRFSVGNARMALALAATASKGDSLASLNDSELIERLFDQNHERDPALLRTAKALSLVYSFDGDALQGDASELSRLASLTGSSVDEVYEHVAELHRRQLIQKRSRWRALLPHAMAHKLAFQALEDFPLQKIEAAFVTDVPERLLKSFSRRLGCLHCSDQAQKIVRGWFGSGGILSDLRNASATYYDVLLNIAPVDQQGAMKALQNTLNGEQEVRIPSEFYRAAITLFRSLAYEPEFFDRALEGLATIAGASVHSNHKSDATTAFESMFFLYLSGTNAKAEQRIAFLMSLCNSSNPSRDQLILGALGAMLKTCHFSSVYSFEFGTRKRDYGYCPASYDEIWDWYHRVYEVAYALSLRPEFRDLIRAKIAENLRLLATNAGPPDKLIELAEKLAADGSWSEGWAPAREAALQAEADKKHEVAKKLYALADKLQPNSLEDRITAFVLAAEFSVISFFRTESTGDDEFRRAVQLANQAAEDVGIELAANDELLQEHLPKLLNANEGRSDVAAIGLGRAAKSPEETWNLIVRGIKSEQPGSRTGRFLAGFMKGLSSKDKEIANNILDESFSNVELYSHIIELQAVYGFDEKGINRIIQATSIENIPTDAFFPLARYRSLDAITAAQLRRILEALVTRLDGPLLAIEIFHGRLLSNNRDGREICESECEIARWLLDQFDFLNLNRDIIDAVKFIISRCLLSGSDDDIVKRLCERFKNGVEQTHICVWDFGDLVKLLFEKFTDIAFTALLEDDVESLNLFRKISLYYPAQKPCLFSDVKIEPMLSWANQDPNSRFFKLAQIIRPWHSHGKDGDGVDKRSEWSAGAMAILVNAPNKLKVFKEFIGSFRTAVCNGSYANFLEARIPLLDEIVKGDDCDLAGIARDELDKLKSEIANCRQSEEELIRNSDERFEF